METQVKNENTQIARFDPQIIRPQVVKHMEDMMAKKYVNLPENYKESIFYAVEKLSTLEEIEKVPSNYIAKALVSMMNSNLDFRKNHCYFFVQNDKNTGKSLRFGWQYQGLISVARSTCGVTDVMPVLVFENDEFSCHYEFGELIIDEHKPTFEGKIIGGYCIVKFQDGSRSAKYYPHAELEKRRNKSKAKSGIFWAWEREMYEKTLINATLKRIIETSSETDAEGLYDEPETTQPRQTIDAEAEIINQDEPEDVPENVGQKKFNL